MTEQNVRFRMIFAKQEEMRYTGHLDLHRTWERTLRRAGVPLAYSQGFNPRPRINLGSALPLGFTSESEVMDIWLEKFISLDELAKSIRLAQPPGLRIQSIMQVDLRAPSLQTELRSAEYQVTLLDKIPELDTKLENLLRRTMIHRRRRGKEYDLRPLIEACERIREDENGHAQIFMRLAAREGATGRPEEVVAELGLSPELARVRRTKLIFKDVALPEMK